MTFTKAERLILSNQYRILESLIPDEADHFARDRKIIEDGYTFHYDDLAQNIGMELPASESERVLEILGMHSHLWQCFQNLEDKGELKESDLRFAGFDGNYEVELLSYCTFFLDTLQRFDELRRSHGYNSHMPTRARYDEMLDRYKTLPMQRPLTLDQIKRVLNK